MMFFRIVMVLVMVVSTMVVTLPASLAQAPEGGLVAYWQFDESEGTVALDSSGRGHDGVLLEGATFGPGVLDRALVLSGRGADGLGAVVQVDDSGRGSDFDLASAITVAVWIRPSALRSASNSVVISKDGSYELRVDAPFTGAWDLHLRGSGTPDAATRLQIDSWQHIAVTWDGSVVRYYYNGQADGVYNAAGPLRSTNTTVSIGARPGGSQALNARLDDLRVYDRALSRGQVAALYALAGSADEVPPVLSGRAIDGALTDGSSAGGSAGQVVYAGTLPAATSQTTVSLSTDEPATCRYATTAGNEYAAMPNVFEVTEGRHHQTVIDGLEDGRTYALFVRCIDSFGNVLTGRTLAADFPILFSVDRPGFDPKDLSHLLFYIESTYFEDPRQRARSIATCRTRECFEGPDLTSIDLHYCDTVVDALAVTGARGQAPDGCIRRWEDQSIYQSLRTGFFPGELLTGRDFGQDDHEKPIFVPDCLNGHPCARGLPSTSAPIFSQNTSFEVEVGDAFASGGPLAQGVPASTGLAGAFSIYHLVKPVEQDENWFYFGCGTGKGLRHNVVNNSLHFSCPQGQPSCTASGVMTRGQAVQPDTWQLIEIHRDLEGEIRVFVDHLEVTVNPPLVATGPWCYHDVMSRQKGLQAMYGDLAASVVIDDLTTDQERQQMRAYFQGLYRYRGTAATELDQRRPSRPKSLAVHRQVPSGVELYWQRSTDNVGVSGYLVFRDGVFLGQTPGPVYTDYEAIAGVSHTYTVTSRDADGNQSGHSEPITVTPVARSPNPSGPRGYRRRACGFDMDDDLIYGEPEDCQVGDGVTLDPDGDGVNEDLIYVDCGLGGDAGGSDLTGDGSPQAPYGSLEHALSVLDGPNDGAEDIVVFKGICSPGNLRVDLKGVEGIKIRRRRGAEERDFQYPTDPAMIIGWDADNDGIYPPFDTDDVAVLDGGEPHCLPRPFSSEEQAHSYFEMAHFQARDYGTCNMELDGEGDLVAEREGGFFLHRGQSGQVNSHHYFHDLQLVNINRGRYGSSRRNLWNMFIGTSILQWMAIENVHMPNSAGYTMRGSVSDGVGVEDSGPIRFQRTSRTCLSTGEPRQGNTQCSGFKLWNLISRVEVLDNVFDFQPEAFQVNDPVANIFGAVSQCTQDFVFRNNEIRDLKSAFGVSFDVSGCTRTPRPIRNVVFDKNEIIVDHPWSQVTCLGVTGCHDRIRTVQDVTYTNNSCSIAGGGRQMVYVDCAPSEGPNPGSLVIAGNTFFAGGDMGSMLRQGLNAATSCTANVEDDIFLKNNIFIAGPDAERLIFTCDLPGLQSDHNVFSPGRSFRWNGARIDTLAEWTQILGHDANSVVCVPEFIDSAEHDLHLSPGDVCAADRGLDLTSVEPLLGRDIDGDSRSGSPTPNIGADESLPR